MDEITAYARKLLDLHGFQNWSVQVVDSDVFAGKTTYSRAAILLNARLASLPVSRWQDVVIHEVAHVRAGQFCAAHGPRWHTLATTMGGTGSVKV